jgi:hypothetical protein
MKRQLTVRAVENAMGIRPPAFKVFREGKSGSLYIPRFFGDYATVDKRQEPVSVSIEFHGTLRDSTRQNEAFRAGVEAFRKVGGGVLSLPPGFGKCLGKDTPVMMFDGSIKLVQHIRTGELIMGDDSTPRNVLSTCTGKEQLYRVVPVKGDSYVVNESHILSLKCNDKKSKNYNKIIDISTRDYIKLHPSTKNKLKGYRVPITFPLRDVPLDPYMFGYWLGDGCSAAANITSQDSTVLHYFSGNLGKYGLHLAYKSKYDYAIRGPKPAYFYKTLKELNVINNKHIPDVYKLNSRKIQLQVLAGLIDSDGSAVKGGWDIIQKNEKLFDDILFLARSLGFSCYKSKCQKTCTNSPNGPMTGTYFRCCISGAGIEDVPCKIIRKKHEPRTQIKNTLHTGIHLEKLDIGEYYGFEIDGNHRFVLGDFTVTHNTTMALAYAAHLKVRTMVIVHKEFLANQWKERIQQFCPGATIGRVQQDTFDIEHDFVIGMIQTMCSRENDPKAFDSIGFVIVDEAHHIGAAAFSQTMFKLCPRYSLGLTATPERKDGLTNILYWFMGPEFFRVQRENQATTRVETVFFDDPVFREAPPVSRFGKINMAGMVTQLTEIAARNQKILSLVRGLDPSRRVLLLSDRREHCFWLCEHLEGAALYLGGMKENELEVSSRAKIIVATYSMAQEGLDIPVLDTLVMTTPHSDVTQAVGRIMRETPGKVNAPLIIDIVDRWSVFNSMYRKRCVIYKTAGFGTSDSDTPRMLDSSAQEFPKGKCLL